MVRIASPEEFATALRNTPPDVLQRLIKKHYTPPNTENPTIDGCLDGIAAQMQPFYDNFAPENSENGENKQDDTPQTIANDNRPSINAA